MTTHVYLIRHAATAYSAEDRFTGASSSSVPLSDEGRRQAALLAKRLASRPPAALYCSPAVRAMETAALLGQPHGLAPQPRDGLSEMDYDFSRARLVRLNDVSHYEGEPELARGQPAPGWAGERGLRGHPAELGGPAANGS